MSNNTLEDLRDNLFATLRALSDKDAPMDIDRSRAIVGVADAIIDTAKVEVEYMKVTGAVGTGFIPAIKPGPALPAPDGITPPGLAGTVRHILK